MNSEIPPSVLGALCRGGALTYLGWLSEISILEFPRASSIAGLIINNFYKFLLIHIDD